MASFDEWLREFFERPPLGDEFWVQPSTYEEPTAEETVEFITTLFEEPERYLDRIPDERVSEALWHIVDPGGSDCMFAVRDGPAPWPKRRRAIRSFLCLFERLFRRRCAECLGHLSQPGGTALNGLCYMWWDISPFLGVPADSPARLGRLLDGECLEVMAQQLSIPHEAVQESALHGLGHWQEYYPERTEAVIERFLSEHRQLRRELVEYAHRALRGTVE